MANEIENPISVIVILPEAMVKKIDELAKEDNRRRSDFLRILIASVLEERGKR